MSIAVAKIIRNGRKCPNKFKLTQKKNFLNATLKKTQRELFDVFSNDSVEQFKDIEIVYAE